MDFQLLRAKTKMLVVAYGEEFYHRALRPMFSIEALLGLAVSAVTIVVLFSVGLAGLALEEASAFAAGLYAALIVALVWLVLNIFLAIFGARKRLADLGSWDGRTFVYRQPRFLAAYKLSRENMGLKRTIPLRDLELNTKLRYHVEKRPDSRWWFVSLNQRGQKFPFKMAKGSAFGDDQETWFGKDRTLYVEPICTEDNADPILVRIYLDSFELIQEGSVVRH